MSRHGTRLRDVELSDVDAYIKMRCDPAMMAELGGPQPRDGIQDKVRRDVQDATSDTAWIKMIVPDEAAPEVAAGPVTLLASCDHSVSFIRAVVEQRRYSRPPLGLG